MAIKVVTKDMLAYYHEKQDAQELARLAEKVDKVDGSRLMTNAEGTKLGTVAEGAQVNVIESVKVDGVALEVEGKAVNIDLSKFAIESEMETALDGKVDKADGMGLMSDAEKAKIANLAENANETYATKAELSAIPKFGKVVVDELPTEGIQEDKIYLVPNSGSGTNARDEYIYVDGAWEMLGTTEVSLEGYYTKAQVDEMIGAIEGDVGAVYTKTEIDAMVETINGDIEAVEGDVADLEAKFADYYTKAQVDSAIDADVKVVSDALAQEVSDRQAAVKAVDDKFASYSTTSQVEAKIAEATNDMATNAGVASAIATATTDMATNAGVDAKVKAVDDKLANYMLSADIEVITTAEIDAMFA